MWIELTCGLLNRPGSNLTVIVVNPLYVQGQMRVTDVRTSEFSLMSEEPREPSSIVAF